MNMDFVNGIMNDTSALIYWNAVEPLFNNGTSNSIILIMCILLTKTFHIKYMHSLIPMSLYFNS